MAFTQVPSQWILNKDGSSSFPKEKTKNKKHCCSHHLSLQNSSPSSHNVFYRVKPKFLSLEFKVSTQVCISNLFISFININSPLQQNLSTQVCMCISTAALLCVCHSSTFKSNNSFLSTSYPTNAKKRKKGLNQHLLLVKTFSYLRPGGCFPHLMKDFRLKKIVNIIF